MAIPITLSVGLLVGVGYVGIRIFSARNPATAVVASSLPRAEAPSVAVPVSAKPTAFPSRAQPEIPVRSNAPLPAAVAERPAAAPETKDETPATKPLAEVRTLPSTPETIPAQSDGVDLIAPQHGERYLQIAAISSHMVPKFLADLNRYHLQANVAPGPHDGLVRVVIGPFPDRESIAQAKAQIEANWPDCFVRLY